ncbi:MAG: hypothetical protein H6679_04285 [Epsilonproteobacteria bacterium]|nr:hypothetical protein [Campylobacterota bacterium]
MNKTKELLQAILNLITHTTFRIFAIATTLVYIALVIGWQFTQFDAAQTEPVLLKPDEQTQQLSSNVRTGLHIHSFPRFSFVQNDFLMDGIIWFRFPKGTESIKTLDDFSIQYSLVKDDKLLFRSDPIIKLLGDEVLVAYHIQVEFKTMLRFKNFPIGDHSLHIIVQNRSITPQELILTADQRDLTINPENLIENWSIRAKRASYGYIKSILCPEQADMHISYPCVVFSIDFKNNGTRDLFSLYFPMFVLFFIALFSLLFRITDTSRLTYIASAVPILVLFRMVIHQLSPIIGYTTHIDFVYYTLVMLSLLILIFQIYVILTIQKKKIGESSSHEAKEAHEYIQKMNDVLFMAILVTLIIALIFVYHR